MSANLKNQDGTAIFYHKDETNMNPVNLFLVQILKEKK